MKGGWKTLRIIAAWSLSILLMTGFWPSSAGALDTAAGYKTQKFADYATTTVTNEKSNEKDSSLPADPAAKLAATTTQTGSLRVVVRVNGALPVEQTAGHPYALKLYKVAADGSRTPMKNHPAVDGGAGTDENGQLIVTGSGNKETTVWIKGLPFGKYNVDYMESDRSIRGYIGNWMGYTTKEISSAAPDTYFVLEVTYTVLHGITLSASVSGVAWEAQTYSYKIEQKPRSSVPGVMDPVWVTLDKENPTWNNIDFRSDFYYNVTILLDNADIPGYERTTTYSFNGATPVTAPLSGNVALNDVTMLESNIAVHHTYTPQFARLRLQVNSGGSQSFAMTVTFDNLPANYSMDNIAAGTATVTRQDATFSLSNLAAGQTVTFHNLPAGTTYTATQTPNSAYTTQYAAAISGLDESEPVWSAPVTGNTVKTLSSSGMQAGTTENIQFINTAKWGTALLTASFTYAADMGFEALAADGNVTLSLVNKTTGQIHYANLALTDGHGSAVLSLPAGSYAVTQTSKPNSLSRAGLSYAWQSVVLSAKQIDITQENQAAVSVENRYRRTTFSFTLDCTVSGDLTADDMNQFYYRITGPAGFQPLTVALTAQNPVWHSGFVPVGTYTVTQLTEKDDNPGYTTDRERYTRVTSYSTGGGFIQGLSAVVSGAKETAAVSFRNHYTRDTGSLTIYRDVTQGTDKQFDYLIVFSPPLPQTGVTLSAPAVISGDRTSLTFTLSASDTYDGITIAGIPTGTNFEIKKTTYTVSLLRIMAADGCDVSVFTGAIEEKDQVVSVEANLFTPVYLLTVEKTIQGDYDGEIFTYELRVDGELWSGKPYMLSGVAGMTAQDGTFTLTSGQSALFEILQGASYQVTEKPNSAYTSSAVNSAGTITGNTVVSFSGAKILTGPALQISFRVEGSAAGEVTEPIRFIVQRGANKISLYAYDIYENGVKSGSGMTDSAGVFSLRVGQTAKFYGLPMGIYTVSPVITTNPLGLNTQTVVPPTIYAQAKIYREADILFDFVGQIDYK